MKSEPFAWHPENRIKDLESELTTLKDKLAEVEAQLVEAKMAADFANAACDLKDKRLDEYGSVHAWAIENVECIRRSHDEWVVELWALPDVAAPTLYEALKKAWEGREK